MPKRKAKSEPAELDAGPKSRVRKRTAAGLADTTDTRAQPTAGRRKQDKTSSSNKTPTRESARARLTKETARRSSPRLAIASQPSMSTKEEEHAADVTMEGREDDQSCCESGDIDGRNRGGDAIGDGDQDDKLAEGEYEEEEEDDEDHYDDEEDENEEDGHEGELPGMGVAHDALQSLFRRLAGASMGGAGGGVSAKVRGLLEGIQDMSDDTRQMIALTELCEMLSMGTEETLQGFPADQVVPVLVNLMNAEYNPDIMLMATRTLTHMIEALPGTCAVAVASQAVPTLCAKLLTIEYIDLAEQSLTCLEKMSNDHGISIVRAGGLSACLSYIDFFSTSLQRVAVTIAANIVRNVPADCFHMVYDMVPNLTNLLQYQDSRILEKAMLCWSRLVDCTRGNGEKISRLAADGVITNLISLATTRPRPVSTTTFTSIIKTLNNMLAGCPSLVANAIDCNITNVVRQLLVGSDTDGPVDDQQTLMMHNPEHMKWVLALTAELLPPLPTTGVFAAPPVDPRFQSNSLLSSLMRIRLVASASQRQPPVTSASEGPDPRETMLKAYPQFLPDCCSNLLAILMDVYTSSASPEVREKSLQALCKMIYFSSADDLTVLLKDLTMAAFAAELLSSEDTNAAVSGMQIAETLMQKLPDIFRLYFTREGVVHEMQKLADAEVKELAVPPTLMSYMQAQSARLAASTSTQNTPSAEHQAQPAPEASAVQAQVPAETATSKEASGSKGKAPAVDGNDNVAPSTLSAPTPSSSQAAQPAGTTAPSSAMALTYTEIEQLRQLAAKCPDTQARKWLKGEANRFLKEHFGGGDGSSAGVSPVLQSLTAVAKELMSTKQTANEDIARALFKRIAEALQTHGDRVAVSSFELMQSGLVTSLLDFLTADTKGDGGKGRLRAFARVFFACANAGVSSGYVTPCEVDHATGEAQSDIPCVVGLLHRLHALLAKSEHFQINESNSGASSSRALSSHLRALVLPMKIRLQRDDDQDSKVKDMSATVILEPLAPISAIEDFLWPQVRLSGRRSRTTSTSSIPEDAPLPSGIMIAEDIEEGEGDLYEGEGDGDEHEHDMDLDDEEEEHDDVDEDDEDGEEQGEDIMVDGVGMEDRNMERQRRISLVHELDLNDEDSNSAAPTGTGPAEDFVEGSQSRPGSVPTTPSRSGRRSSSEVRRARLKFFLNGYELTGKMSLLHAVQRFARSSGGPARQISHLLQGVITLKYRLNEDLDFADTNPPTTGAHGEMGRTEDTWGLPRVVRHILDRKPLQSIAEADESTYCILQLMRIIANINDDWHELLEDGTAHRAVVSATEFINTKLTAKLMRQARDPLTVTSQTFPEWCTALVSACPFLFPFEVRQIFLQSTAFGISRALTLLQQHTQGGENEREEALRNVQRQKVRISRDRIMDSCIKLLETHGKERGVLEIEYQNEVGTGLGPTLEFFTLASREFQKANLGMWRTGGSSDAEVRCLTGLFPAPVSGECPQQVRRLFNVLGRLVARALLDARMLDVPLSPAVYKWLLGMEDQMTLSDIDDVDPALASTLRSMQALCHKKNSLDGAVMGDEERAVRMSELKLDGADIEDLCLDWTLPGYPEVELKANGQAETVSLRTLQEYIQLVTRYTLIDSVRQQMIAFRQGFDAIIKLENIKGFTPHEMDVLVCGASETWDRQMLLAAIKPDHGYTHSSQAITWLLEILESYDCVQQRQFLQFVTGSPRLPVGGLKSLSPSLTIVRRQPVPPLTPDDYLPSVMTCVNYLKLPDYSSRAIMAARIETAVKEGKDSFHLS